MTHYILPSANATLNQILAQNELGELKICRIEPVDAIGMCHVNALRREDEDWEATLGWTVLQEQGAGPNVYLFECHSVLVHKRTGAIRDTTRDYQGQSERAWVKETKFNIHHLRALQYPLIYSWSNNGQLSQMLRRDCDRTSGGKTIVERAALMPAPEPTQMTRAQRRRLERAQKKKNKKGKKGKKNKKRK